MLRGEFSHPVAPPTARMRKLAKKVMRERFGPAVQTLAHTFKHTIWPFARALAEEWRKDNVPLLAAALAFYSIFSITPLFIIAIAIVGLILGPAVAQQEVLAQVALIFGPENAQTIQQLITNSSSPSGNIIAIVIGATMLFFGSSWMFTQMKDALNIVWDVEHKPEHGVVTGFVWNRFLGFLMVLGVGAMLVASLIINMLLSALHLFVGDVVPGVVVWGKLFNFFLSTGLITLLILMIFKVLPDAHITWDDAWLGAAVTSLLFNIGRLLISLYLTNSGVSSTYGAAGSLVAFLLWVYFSAQILLFGAEFTQLYAQKYGSQITGRPGGEETES